MHSFLPRALILGLVIPTSSVSPGAQNPATWPAGRSCHSLTYDAARGAVTMLGGSPVCGQEPLPDSALWMWDGRAWRAIQPAGPSPGAREDAMIAFDSRRGVLVLYGGRRGRRVFEDTWEWNGTAWTHRSPGAGPGIVEHAAVAFDETRGRVVLFGGGFRSGAPMSGETWEWDGATWSRRSSGGGPKARVGHSMTWSPTLRTVVLYGGFADSGSFTDLWQWNGSTWSVVDTAGPTPTEGPSLVNGQGNVLTVIGTGTAAGVESGAPLRAWRWTRGRWEAIGGAGPVSRVGQAMGYDPARQRLLLFGGFRPGSGPLDDLWEFDGRIWSRVARP